MRGDAKPNVAVTLIHLKDDKDAPVMYIQKVVGNQKEKTCICDVIWLDVNNQPHTEKFNAEILVKPPKKDNENEPALTVVPPGPKAVSKRRAV
jgi:hypothetical protein